MGIVGLVCWGAVKDELSIFSTACVVWGSDGSGCVGDRELSERLVRAVPDSQGIFMVADGLPATVNIMACKLLQLNPGV